MITLYNFTHGVRGIRVAWQCEEMGLAYRTVAYDFPVPDSFRAKYPLGVLPFLEDDGGVGIGESVAQMIYLTSRYGPTTLLPQAPADQARVLQLAIASEASLGGLMNPMMGAKFTAPADQKSNWSDSFCEARVKGVLDYLEAGLGDRAYLVGDSLSLADIAISTALGVWQGALSKPVPPALAEHRTRMMARPTYQRAVAAFKGA
jgi:glutathione S-transferase